MIIIDASVVNKFFLPHEEDHMTALEILKLHIQKKENITVPDLLFYEVANTLATKTTIPHSQIVKTLAKLDNLKLHIFHPTIIHIIKAASFAKQYKVSVYDAIYAILAIEKKCKLITADSKFISQINQKYIMKLGSNPA